MLSDTGEFLEAHLKTTHAYKHLPLWWSILYMHLRVENIESAFLFELFCLISVFIFIFGLHGANSILENLISRNNVFMKPDSFMLTLSVLPYTESLLLLVLYKGCHCEINVKLLCFLA